MSHTNIEFKDIKLYLDKGAVVLDVRTDVEYNDGHLSDSLHIVLDQLEAEIHRVKALQKPIITCCRSGARSERAKDLLAQNDIDVINCGPWQNVKSHI